MLFRHFLCSLFHSSPKAKGRRPASPTPLAKRVRMFLEKLEDRIVPSVTLESMTIVGNTLNISDSVGGACLSIKETDPGTYCVSLSDNSGYLNTQSFCNVQNININLQGNTTGNDSDSVILSVDPCSSTPPLCGNLSISDKGAWNQLCVSICPDFNVNGNVSISTTGSSSSLAVNSNYDCFGGNVSISAGTNANPSSWSSVCLTGDQIGGNLTVGVSASSENDEYVNLSCDGIYGNANITEGGNNIGNASITVSNTGVSGSLNAAQSSGCNQSISVCGTQVEGFLTANQSGGSSADTSLYETCVGGNLSITQSASDCNTLSTSCETYVGGSALLSQTGSGNNTVCIDGTEVSNATVIKQTATRSSSENSININCSTFDGTVTGTQGAGDNNVALDEVYLTWKAIFQSGKGNSSFTYTDISGPGKLTDNGLLLYP